MNHGHMRWLVLAVAAAVALGGCSNRLAKTDPGRDAVDRELDKASRQKMAPAESLNEALLPPLPLDVLVPPKAAEQRFDLAVSGAPAAQVFLALVSGTRYSMLLPPDLGGTISVNLKNVTIREALDAIRDVYGYEYSIQGTRIFVQPNTMQTRLFQVSYLATKRGGGSATRVSAGAANANAQGGTAAATPGQATGGSESTSVFTGQSTDFWFDLAQAVAITLGCDFEIQRTAATTTGTGNTGPGAASIAQALGQRLDKLKCPDGRNMVVNQQSGIVMVRAMPAELREIARMLKAMQANIERQVMIEAKIIEVELSEGFQSGINWQSLDSYGRPRWGMNTQTGNIGAAPPSVTDLTLTGSAGLLSSFASGGVLGLAFQTGNFASLINFLESQGKVYVMSSPRIATLNNQKAVLKVGSDDYYITAVTPPSYSSTGGSATTSVNPPSITTQPFFSGVSLDVTPQIDDAGHITLHIRPAVTEVTEKPKTIDFGTQGGTFILPYASSKVKETDSIVRVRDGMIVAIGGLMSHTQDDSRAKVPGAGDVPGADFFFKQLSYQRGKKELVILLKPTVIRDDNDWQQDIDDTRQRIRDLDPQRNKPQGG